MPYPRRKSFQKWKECPRCGFHWPSNQLYREYTGSRVCPECLDEEGYSEHKKRVTLRTEELSTEERIEPII